MRKKDQVHEAVPEQPRNARDGVVDGDTLIQALAEMMSGETRLPLLLLTRPSRRFERMLTRELARSRRQCGVHCWKQLRENLPGEVKRAKKEEER